MKKWKQLRLAAIAMGLGLAGAAHATVDSTITAGISSYGSDGQTYATAVISAGFLIWVVKKLGRKMGWW